jgi:hypothetical protein
MAFFVLDAELSQYRATDCSRYSHRLAFCLNSKVKYCRFIVYISTTILYCSTYLGTFRRYCKLNSMIFYKEKNIELIKTNK